MSTGNKISDETRAVFDQFVDRPIAFHPCLVKITGSLASGVLLSQLLYWSKAMHGKEYYKTDKELIVETGLTKNEIRGAKLRLKQKGLIATRLKRQPAITHYTIKGDLIIKAISSLVKSTKLGASSSPSKIGEVSETIPTENTTKTSLSSFYEKAKEIIEDLNQKTGQSYKFATGATQRLIKARLREGFTVENFKTVHDTKIPEWINDQKMKRYLRPKTLYSSENFDSYLNEQAPKSTETIFQETEQEGLTRQEQRRQANEQFDQACGVA